ncbi:hypothetical protein DEI81_07725 [Curtobacterium sp. MCBD17_013]|nr:hypothetical protein DEI81_07725 [Curtobacterium sp. MCBD17_013]
MASPHGRAAVDRLPHVLRPIARAHCINGDSLSERRNHVRHGLAWPQHVDAHESARIFHHYFQHRTVPDDDTLRLIDDM